MSKESTGFVLLSGIGWTLDLVVMTLLIYLDFEPGVSNFVSASLAASFVYWSGRKLLFKKGIGLSATGGYLFYLTYTTIVVVIFSALIQYSSVTLHTYLMTSGYQISLATVAFILKVCLTPLNLALNFIVSRSLAKRF